MTFHQVITTQLVYGIPYEWFEEVSAACDDSFRRRGLPIKGADLKQQIHIEAKLGRIKRKHQNETRNSGK